VSSEDVVQRKGSVQNKHRNIPIVAPPLSDHATIGTETRTGEEDSIPPNTSSYVGLDFEWLRDFLGVGANGGKG
jgi:hypothetical protein